MGSQGKRCLRHGLVMGSEMQQGRKEWASTQHQAQLLPGLPFTELCLLHNSHTMRAIVATEKKMSLAVKSGRLKSSGMVFKIPAPAQKKNSSIKAHFRLQLNWWNLHPKIAPQFVFRDLSSFGGSSTSEVPEIQHKENVALCSRHLHNWPICSLPACLKKTSLGARNRNKWWLAGWADSKKCDRAEPAASHNTGKSVSQDKSSQTTSILAVAVLVSVTWPVHSSRQWTERRGLHEVRCAGFKT